MLLATEPIRAAYIHVPFCRHHCGYCDFAVVAGRDDRAGAYVDALAIELASMEQPAAVETIFIGGGTPTYLKIDQLDRLLSIIRRWLPMQPGGEWSVESTPDSLSDDCVRLLAEHGVNRVSIGAQSFQDDSLRTLDRRHEVGDISPAVDRVRRRIANISLDLIFGVPGQSAEQWQADLARAAALEPSHMSCYGLTYEKGTPLWREQQSGRVVAVNDEIERDMYLHAHDRLTELGYEHYEISNYARPQRRCRHNEVYWANDSYFGFGLGAARFVDGRRELNTRSLDEYISRIAAGRSPVIQSEALAGIERAQETLFVQLRRREGIHRVDFRRRTGLELGQVVGEALKRLIDLGLLHEVGESVCLTREGMCVADSVMTELWSAHRAADEDQRNGADRAVQLI